MSGRVVVVAILLITAVFGGFQWWFHTRAYYAPIESAELAIALDDSTEMTLSYSDFEGIDADTSPLRFRACFTLDVSALAATEGAVTYDEQRRSSRRIGSPVLMRLPSAKRWKPARHGPF